MPGIRDGEANTFILRCERQTPGYRFWELGHSHGSLVLDLAKKEKVNKTNINCAFACFWKWYK